MNKEKVKIIDCTFRDGGYYNNWNFDPELVNEYLAAMDDMSIEFVELGFRSFDKVGFKGAFAFTSDEFVLSLNAPTGLKLGVMVNAAELIAYPGGVIAAIEKLFKAKKHSPISLVRIACHFHEFEDALPSVEWLKKQGYFVGINLMQIAERTEEEIRSVSKAAKNYPLDVLYFADSMGSMDPIKTSQVISAIRTEWSGPIGIHAHDNMGAALVNSLTAVGCGATWIDGTVSGMGRGPGNVKTEYLVIELESLRATPSKITRLASLIDRFFKPMQDSYRWGTNIYYFLAGKYGIHPTYIQEMMQDSRYSASDILSVVEYLKTIPSKKFFRKNLEVGRSYGLQNIHGTWSPKSLFSGKELLVIGSGLSARQHKGEIERYIRAQRPLVIALNKQKVIDSDLVGLRAACHPMRLLADYKQLINFSEPLVIPGAFLPESISSLMKNKSIFDFGLEVSDEGFEFLEYSCRVPSMLVAAYVLAMAASGNASRVLLAGFDGFGSDDPRTSEMENMLTQYMATPNSCQLISITPTYYSVPQTSVYGMGAYD